MEPLFASKTSPRIALIAGEASGDLLGASLITAIRQHQADAQFAGIGGGRMLALGFHSICPINWLSVNGYVEVLKRLPKLLRLRRQLIKQLLQERPDVVVGIDAPDFNLALEKACKKAGIRVVHYVSPSVWAWRKQRIFHVQQAADHVLCLFPMEPALYADIGMPATFVGHPLADQIAPHIDRDEVREKMDLPTAATVVAMLPGSRQSEIQRIGPVLLETAKRLSEQYPEMQFLVPLATPETHAAFQTLQYEMNAQQLPLRLMYGHAQMAMAAAALVIVKSGTSTLEAALMKRPMIITYKVARLTAWLMKRKAYLPWVGLPNILANTSLVPELLQDEATPEHLVQAVDQWLKDEDARARVLACFDVMHTTLRQNAAEKAAAVVLSVMRGAGARA